MICFCHAVSQTAAQCSIDIFRCVNFTLGAAFNSLNDRNPLLLWPSCLYMAWAQHPSYAPLRTAGRTLPGWVKHVFGSGYLHHLHQMRRSSGGRGLYPQNMTTVCRSQEPSWQLLSTEISYFAKVNIQNHECHSREWTGASVILFDSTSSSLIQPMRIKPPAALPQRHDIRVKSLHHQCSAVVSVSHFKY